ncbi:DUF3238 domain-containing protein [Marininema halotolerans]|uniref:Uncharacterized protein n=1 Tax=Marininema halotolerans TaxID=1155944 RepID=A0A1I6Q4Q3_9BACL|nr:DUF3238 domain-containing protein [Marininema halotolerans]SFS47310.1 Protein of unknown function [Marininema halotolerans]
MLVIFLFSFCLTTNEPVVYGNNSENEFRNISINPNVYNIKIKWENIGDNYKLDLVVDNNKIKEYWSGKENNVLIDKLEEDHIYKFILKAYDNNGKLINYAKISTKTLKSNKLMTKNKTYIKSKLDKNKKINSLNYHMDNAYINSIIQNKSTILSWYNLPNDKEKYKVYKNNKLIAEVTGNNFVDKDISYTKIDRYNIVGYKNIPHNVVEEKNKKLKSIGESVSSTEKKELKHERKELGIIINRDNSNNKNKVKNSKSKINRSPDIEWRPGYILQYTTFIPLESAPNPYCTIMGIDGVDIPYYCADFLGSQGYDSFHGDGRTFDPWTSTKFRTRSTAYFNWDNETGEIVKKIKHIPETGETIGYKDGKEVARGKAPESDMKIEDESFGDDWASFKMFLASSNPLVLAPDIDAFYYAKVHKNGDGEYYGVHDQAPSHEFYMGIDASEFSYPIHQQEHQGFNYLWALWPRTEWQVSVVDWEATGDTQYRDDEEIENSQWKNIGDDNIGERFSNVTNTVDFTGDDFKVKFWSYNGDIESTYELYEKDEEGNPSDFIGSCKVKGVLSECVWNNVSKYIDGSNKKAELFLKKKSDDKRTDKVNFYSRSWTKIGEDLDFSSESKRVYSTGGSFKVKLWLSPSNITSGTYALYEKDEEGNPSDFIGNCKIDGNPQECTWDNIDKFVDGKNKKAELFIKKIEGKNDKAKVYFYD